MFGVGLESDSGNIDSGQTIQTSLLKDYQRLILIQLHATLIVRDENAIASKPDRNTTICCVLRGLKLLTVK